MHDQQGEWVVWTRVAGQPWVEEATFASLVEANKNTLELRSAGKEVRRVARGDQMDRQMRSSI